MAGKSSAVMNVRLLINKKTSEIIYAEAGKDFVDLLFSFLTLPIGSVMKLLYSSKRVASVTNLYDSMVKLPGLFMSANKSELLDPRVVSTYSNETLRINNVENQNQNDNVGNFYVCTNIRSGYNSTIHYVSRNNGERCACGSTMNCSVQFPPNASQSSNGVTSERSSGYVKETVTFIITDDLKVSPSSTITSINLLNQLNIKDLSELEEESTNVGRNEALELLWASLVSTTPLNDVFAAGLSKSSKKTKH